MGWRECTTGGESSWPIYRGCVQLSDEGGDPTDIKYLQGWKVNQKIPALNILDYASSMQLMIPIFQRETSDIIREKFLERWVSWAGMPTEIVCDPAKPNVADALTVPLEQGGSTVKITAADAHWQLGKTEVHGGRFQSYPQQGH